MGGRGSSGGKNYSETGGLDEFDEEMLNDAQLQRESEETELTQYTPEQVRGALTKANNAMKAGDSDKLNSSVNRLNTMLSTGDLSPDEKYQIERKIAQINATLDRIWYEERRQR